MGEVDKPIVWLHGAIKTPPFSKAARLEAGFFLRLLQKGESLGMPKSRPMPAVGSRCHELRITDESVQWRVIYRLDEDAVIVTEVFRKKMTKTPRSVIAVSRAILARYDNE